MNEIKRWFYSELHNEIRQESHGKYVLHSDHEAEVARLRADAEALRDVLAPFAEYERVRSKMGGTSPKSGQLFGVHSSAGSAELSVEDFKAAIAAMGESA